MKDMGVGACCIKKVFVFVEDNVIVLDGWQIWVG